MVEWTSLAVECGQVLFHWLVNLTISIREFMHVACYQNKALFSVFSFYDSWHGSPFT